MSFHTLSWESQIPLLSSKDASLQRESAAMLRRIVDFSMRDKSEPEFLKLMVDVSKAIFQLLSSNDTSEKLGGLSAISEVVTVLSDYEQFQKFSTFIKGVINKSNNTEPVIVSSIQTLVKLFRLSGSPGFVENELSRALSWLTVPVRQTDALIILTELGQSCPTVLCPYVEQIITQSWILIRDRDVNIRLTVTHTLDQCLKIVTTKLPDRSENMYAPLRALPAPASCNLLHDNVVLGYTLTTIEGIHGTLLMGSLLLQHTQDFMMPHFAAFGQMCLACVSHKSDLVRKTVASTTPLRSRLAPATVPLLVEYDRVSFTRLLLPSFVATYLNSIQSDRESGHLYYVLGELFVQLPSEMKAHADRLTKLILHGLGSKRNPKKYIVHCVSLLVQALRGEVSPFVRTVLPQRASLSSRRPAIGFYLPEFLPFIQERLLNEMSLLLCHLSYYQIISQNPTFQLNLKSPHIALVLEIFETFNFSDLNLVKYLFLLIFPYLRSHDPQIRRQTSTVVCKLLLNHGLSQRRESRLIRLMLTELLQRMVSDPDFHIRQSILSNLDSRYVAYLSEPEFLNLLFTALSDQVYENRLSAISLIRQVSERQAVVTLPYLRCYLLRSLDCIKYWKHNHLKELEMDILLHLIRACSSQLSSFLPSVYGVVHGLLDCAHDGVIINSVLLINEAVKLHFDAFEPRLQGLFSLCLDVVSQLDSQSRTKGSRKAEAALLLLSTLSQSPDYSCGLFLRRPDLLNQILVHLGKQQCGFPLKESFMRALGRMGVLSRSTHRQLCAIKPSESRFASLCPEKAEHYIIRTTLDVINKILFNNSLHNSHDVVIDTLVTIFNHLGENIIPYLPTVIPSLFRVISSCDLRIRDRIFIQLHNIIKQIRDHIIPYMPELVSIICSCWDKNLTNLLKLIESLHDSIRSHFDRYLPSFLPLMIQVLEDTANKDQIVNILRTVNYLSSDLAPYGQVLLPILLYLLDTNEGSPEIERMALSTLVGVCRVSDASFFVSRTIDSLSRLLSSPGSSPYLSASEEVLCALFRSLRVDPQTYMPVLESLLNQFPEQFEELRRVIVSRRKGLPQDPQWVSIVSPPSRAPVLSPSSSSSSVNAPASPSDAHQSWLKQGIERIWNAESQTTADDWSEWFRRFTGELVKYSPSKILQSCARLLSTHESVQKDLFNSFLISIWNALIIEDPMLCKNLIKNLQVVMVAPQTPIDILQTVSNFLEFMERRESALPILTEQSSQLAQRCGALSKLVYYKEQEFLVAPERTIEPLIALYKQLDQPDAASGLIDFALAKLPHSGVSGSERWYERMGNWERALSLYESHAQSDPDDSWAICGCLRCYSALGRYADVVSLTERIMEPSQSSSISEEIYLISLQSYWALGRFADLSRCLSLLEPSSVNRQFYESVFETHEGRYESALRSISQCRKTLDESLTVLVHESYNRSYRRLVMLEKLSDLEEVVEIRSISWSADQYAARVERARRRWYDKLVSGRKDVSDWPSFLCIFRLLFEAKDLVDLHLKYASLSIRHQNSSTSLNVLHSLALQFSDPKLSYLFSKWLQRNHRPRDAQRLLGELKDQSGVVEGLRVKCLLRYSDLLREESEARPSPELLFRQVSLHDEVLSLQPGCARAWHQLAHLHSELCERQLNQLSDSLSPSALEYLLRSVQCLVKSITFSRADSAFRIQDVLKLLTLLFHHGGNETVIEQYQQQLPLIQLDIWLEVLPQLIARLSTPYAGVLCLLRDLLVGLGREHRHAVIFSVTALSHQGLRSKQKLGQEVLDRIRDSYPVLVGEVELVRAELIQIAIQWGERVCEALEKASNAFYVCGSVRQMVSLLLEMHATVGVAPRTMKEIWFTQRYLIPLKRARAYLERYQRREPVDWNIPWSIYFSVYRELKKWVKQIRVMNLEYNAPALLTARHLELSLPGTYRHQDKSFVSIERFESEVQVIPSKQRPRKISIQGSDGRMYRYLLKGHEDLRLDERVMQVFGLVNFLLRTNDECSRRQLGIRRYVATPLSYNAGLIEWVENTDTLNSLIKQYRENYSISPSLEQRVISQRGPFDTLPIIHKIEVFQHMHTVTKGLDLHKIFWLQSCDSEVWLEKRTTYTRSLAVMSMVGYLIGLGDRHPSNLMLDRFTGEICHIDFGDCFEVAIKREKFPETVPFRLTRMLRNVMEVQSIDGVFKKSCVLVMDVLRSPSSRDSLLTMLEAFVYDPLFTWILKEQDFDPQSSPGRDSPREETAEVAAGGFRGVPWGSTRTATASAAAATAPLSNGASPENSASPKSMLSEGAAHFSFAGHNAAAAVSSSRPQNERALGVIRRIRDKLAGNDFEGTLDVPAQVERLIREATSVENLCQLYIGW